MAIIKQTKSQDFTCYVDVDGSIEVRVLDVVTEEDARGFRGREKTEVARFTVSARAAARLASELSDALAYAVENFVKGVPHDQW